MYKLFPYSEHATVLYKFLNICNNYDKCSEEFPCNAHDLGAGSLEKVYVS